MTSDSLLMSMPEVAELAGVQRPVVTMWRRRHADFPRPASTETGRPFFHPRDIADWLVATGRAERRDLHLELSLYTLADLGRRMTPAALWASLTALLCLRHLDDEPLSAEGAPFAPADLVGRAARVDAGDTQLLSEIKALGEADIWLAAVADDLVEGAWGCTGAFERLLSARARLGFAELAPDTLDAELVRLVAGISGAADVAERVGSLVLADPRAGAGDLLVATLQRLPEDAEVTVLAAESTRRLARLVRRRLTVLGVREADSRVRLGRLLAADAPAPDVLVTNLPYEPGLRRRTVGTLGQIDEIAARLAIGQAAVVLGPADALTAALAPYDPAATARNRLIGSGMVEAVVKLPGGVTPYRPGYQTALWVLRNEPNPAYKGRVLLADVSDRPLIATVVDDLITDVVTWRREGHHPGAHARTFGTQVSVADLLSPRTALTARRPPTAQAMLAPGEAELVRLGELDAQLAGGRGNSSAETATLHTGIASHRDGPARRYTTIAALVRDRRLSLVKGTRLAPGHLASGGHHRVLGAAEATGQSAIGARTIDRITLADNYQRVRLTEPGDVIVTTTPHLGAIVDRDGYAVVEFPARVLRIPTDERTHLTPAVLAALLTGSHPGQRVPGTVRPPLRLDEHRLPVLTPGEVDALDALLAHLDVRRRTLLAQVDALDEVRGIATAGLTNGTLTINQHI